MTDWTTPAACGAILSTWRGASAIAQYADTFYADRAAATRHSFGKRTAYYIGTRPDTNGTAWLLNLVCNDAGVQAAYHVPEGVEVVRRHGKNTSLLYMLNHRNESVDIALRHDATDLVTGQPVEGMLTLAARGVAVLMSEETSS